jgi:hypothetical protein
MMLLLLACSSSPDVPESMKGMQEALGHWEKAEAHRLVGEFEPAWNALEKALLADTQSPELWLSAGHVLAALGRLEEAISYAGKSIDLRPKWHNAHYDRACWLSLAGRLEEAAKDLRFALGEGGVDLLTAAADSDLDPLREDPRFAGLLPEKALPAEVSADEQAYFLGSEWAIDFRFLNRPNQSVQLDLSGPRGLPAKALRAVEDITPQSGVNAHSVRFVFRVTGAGEGTLGPWSIASGGLERSLAPVGFAFLAPPNQDASQVQALAPGSFSIPSTLFASVPLHQPVRKGEQVLVKTLGGERVEWLAKNGAQYELRLEGQTEWVGWQGALPKDSAIRIIRGRKEILVGRY